MADADLLSIGEQCAVASCHQNDFLPFCCAACKHTFCLEHFRPAAHQCTAHGAEATALVCPLCALAIKLRPDEDPNAAFEAHTREARLRRFPLTLALRLPWRLTCAVLSYLRE